MSAEDKSAESQTSGDHQRRGKENELAPDEFCFECKSSLVKSPELINVNGQSRRRWHPECFKCIICREPMDRRTSCHIYRDQVVCRTDYLRLKRDNSIKCKRCRWPIGASDWVRKAADYVYHLACFNCDICFRQLNTGEQFVINSQANEMLGVGTSGDCNGNNDTVRLMCKLHFTVENGRQHEDSISVPSGSGTSTESGQSYSAQAKGSPDSSNPSPISPEHDNNQQLSTKLAGKQRQRHQALKLNHYHRLTLPGAVTSQRSSPSLVGSVNCQVSGQTVGGQLRRQPSPHSLMTHLPTGEDYSLAVSPQPPTAGLGIDESFINHHHRNPSSRSSSKAGSSSSSVSSLSSVTNLACTSGPMTPTSCGGNVGGSGEGSSGGGGGLQSKSKRVRTTFTEDQLSILQTHFQIDSNPDGQDLERIATITGLSKRVTQVWFQNSRARQKKYMIKRKPSHSSTVSMVTSLGHGHHHDHHHNPHTRGHHSHFSHQLNHPNLTLINQSNNSPSNELSPSSPNLELNNGAQALQLMNSARHKIQAQNSEHFSDQFLDISFVSDATQSKAISTHEENEIAQENMNSKDASNRTCKEEPNLGITGQKKVESYPKSPSE